MFAFAKAIKSFAELFQKVDENFFNRAKRVLTLLQTPIYQHFGATQRYFIAKVNFCQENSKKYIEIFNLLIYNKIVNYF